MNEHINHSSPSKLTRIQTIRFYIRSALIIVLMLVMGGLAKFFGFFLKPFPKLGLRFRRFMFRRMTAGMLFLMKVKVKVTGKIPKPPYILMGNHVGYVDILVIASLTGTPFVAKKEVRSWPIIGWLTELYGGLFIDRENRADVCRFPELLQQWIARGDSMTIFPEGTSTNGQAVLPFHSSLFQWPAQNEFPVHTSAISYKTGNAATPAADFVCWWGDMDFGPHFKMLVNLRRTEATIHFSETPVTDSSRKVLASKAREAVEHHFIKSES